MRVLGTAAKWFFMLCLPVLLLGTSLGGAASNHWLYKYGLYKYDVSQRLSKAGLHLSDSEIEGIYAGLISYFNSDDEYIDLTVVKDGKPINLFSPEEVIHFRDVKGLIWLDYWLLLGTLIYILGYAGVSFFWQKKKYRRRMARAVACGSGITLALILVLALGIVFDFSPLFYQFHLLFFSNIYWSAEGYMLLLFPEDFFQDAAMFCALATTAGAMILGGVAGGYLFFTKKERF
ncbi:DUF1461 domain-containing protein [Chloroflexota bacterium]